MRRVDRTGPFPKVDKPQPGGYQSLGKEVARKAEEKASKSLGKVPSQSYRKSPRPNSIGPSKLFTKLYKWCLDAILKILQSFMGTPKYKIPRERILSLQERSCARMGIQEIFALEAEVMAYMGASKKPEKEAVALLQELRAQEANYTASVSTYEEYQELKSAIMQGNLEVAERAPLEWLTRAGYVEGVVPDDYVNSAMDIPADKMQVIYRNYRVIQKVTGNETQFYLKDMKAVSQHIVENFQSLREQALRVAGKLIPGGKQDLSSAEELKSALEAANVDDELQETLEELILDIEYIDKALEMEYALAEDMRTVGGLVMSDVVPPTGLIKSLIERTKQEIRTVVELRGEKLSS